MKPALTLAQQVAQLQNRGMQISDVAKAKHYLANISYYRLAGYWWEMQADRSTHSFKPTAKFDQVIRLYTFDRDLKLQLFDAIERLEIALRTKLIYHMSVAYGPLWYRDPNHFASNHHFNQTLQKINIDFAASKEEFVVQHKANNGANHPEAWKALEVVTLNTISRLYENLKHQLPQKSEIANEFGLNSHNILESWLRSITYIRNIIAHHSRLWNRVLINRYRWPNSPLSDLLDYKPDNRSMKKLFPILSAILYMEKKVSPNNSTKQKLLQLLNDSPEVPVGKMGFYHNWRNQPIWKD